jgi:amino acid transporter
MAQVELEASTTGARVSRLRSKSIGLPGAVVQSAALIGPAAGVTAGNIFIAQKSGIAAPFEFVLGMVVCLSIAVVIGDYARQLPSAGSFYTYLTRSFGPKVGFVTGVMLFGAYILLLPFQLTFLGSFTHDYLATYGVHIGWQFYALALILISTGLAAAGISPALAVGLVALAFEVIVFSILAVVILVKGGAHGLSLQPFNPAKSATGFSGVVLGAVYTIFAFVGFESSTTLGEEVRESRRTIPRAVLLTTLVIGAFFVVVTFAEVVGFGLGSGGVHNLENNATPFNALANTFIGGPMSTLITLATISSFIGLNIVTVNAGARMIYAMGRDGMLPRWLDHTNVRRAPSRAALLVGVWGVSTALIMGSIWGPVNLASWASFLATLFFIAAYALLNVGVFRFYQRDFPEQFGLLRHVIVPVVGLIGIGVVTYGNVHPLPPSPLRYFIWTTLAVIAIASFVAVWLERRNPALVREAGQLFAAAPSEGDDEDVVTAAASKLL